MNSSSKTSPSAIAPTDLVPMAKVGSPFGVRGWVHVFADTETPESLLDYTEVWLGSDGAWRQYKIEDAQLHGKGMVVKFLGCNDRDQAFVMRNLDIAIPREELPEAGDDEFYWTDLIGMQVQNLAGQSLGVVDNLMESGAHDILVVKGEKQRLIPFVKDIVLEVKDSDQQIIVDWGLDY